nr:SGNH/GDSL hydrolase family protein [uncultured Acetatifactor sp.]
MKNQHLSPDTSKQFHKIPDLDIIDLDQEDDLRAMGSDESGDSLLPDESPESAERKPRGNQGVFSHINIHIVLLAVFLLFVAGIIYKIATFGVHIDLDEIFADGPGEYNDTYDTILPLLDKSNNPVYMDFSEGSTILAFGNAPFADDRNSEDNLVNLMRQETGATIYNCSISGSYLAALRTERDMETAPQDIFHPYWLCQVAAHNQSACDDYLKALEILGDDAPPEAKEVYDTLQSIRLEEVDAIVLMYDASDYLAGHVMINPADATDITTFTGGTEAVIEYLQFYYSNVRLIVMSPTYAYAIDDNGDYISSDMKRYGGQDVLSTYAILQYASCVSRSVTFVDNIYNTITEDNAEKYLSDNIHLNPEGRKKVAERFAYALNYYNEASRNSSPPAQD